MIDNTKHLLTGFLLLALLAFGAFPQSPLALYAQEEDEEMAVEPDAPVAPPRGAAAKPTKKKTDEAEPARPEPLAVRTILEAKPTTPAELFQAATVLVDLNRPALAKNMLAKITAAKLTPQASAALVRKFGSGALLAIANNSDLQPEAGELVDAILAATEAYRTDPKQLAQWVRDLSAPQAEQREDAAIELLQSHSAAVAPLLAALADPARASEHAAAMKILVRLGGDATEPLLGALTSKNPALVKIASEAVGQTRAEAAMMQLIAPSVSPQADASVRKAAGDALVALRGNRPTLAEAKILLEREVQKRLQRSLSEDVYPAQNVIVWQWDPASKASVPVEYRASDADAAIAAILARDLYDLEPQNLQYRHLYLTALLDAAKYRGGLERPLAKGAGTVYETAAQFGVETLDDLLLWAMTKGHTAAATAAAEILGDIGSAALLTQPDGHISPLADALRHENRRLRFAALMAILKFQPTEPFAGASFATEALQYFVGTFGAPKALVAHPRGELGQQLAGLLAGLGYEPDLATNSRKAFQLASTTPDYELMLVHMALGNPSVDDLLRQLRRERRTALLPVGLLEIADDLPRAERLARGYPLVQAIAVAQDEAGMKSQVERLLASAGRDFVPHEERGRQATAALGALATLAQQAPQWFDSQRVSPAVERVLYVPELTAPAAIVLGKIGTQAAQRALVDLAARLTQPIEVRQAAALAFAGSVRRFGTLLVKAEILRQYDNYNSSGDQDKATQEVLSSILDTLEKKSD